MIVRTWRGATSAAEVTAYLEYLMRTGIPEYEATPGNLGTLLLHRTVGDREEYLILSWWNSIDDVQGFAGPDSATAVFYPEDDRFLVDRDLMALHWQIGHSSIAPRDTSG